MMEGRNALKAALQERDREIASLRKKLAECQMAKSKLRVEHADLIGELKTSQKELADTREALTREKLRDTPPEEKSKEGPVAKKLLYPGFARFVKDLRAVAFDWDKPAPDYTKPVKSMTPEEKAKFEKEVQDQMNLPQVDLEDATLIGSAHRWKKGMHRVVLDVDMEVHVQPSSTKGHNHLIINKMMTEEKYFKLLDALAEAGIIERGYAEVSKLKGGTWIRPPWVKKQRPQIPFSKIKTGGGLAGAGVGKFLPPGLFIDPFEVKTWGGGTIKSPTWDDPWVLPQDFPSMMDKSKYHTITVQGGGVGTNTVTVTMHNGSKLEYTMEEFNQKLMNGAFK